MKTVLVLDACQRSALAVTRSLGRHGVPVHTADEESEALAGTSRYSLQYHRYPSPRTDPVDFILAVQQICTQNQVDMLMPMTELTSTLLLENRHSFNNIKLPFADLETVNQLANKSTLIRTAASLNIPAPASLHFNDASKINSSDPGIQFPVVIKPAVSWIKHKARWQRAAVKAAHSKEDLQTIFSKDELISNHPLMMQEFIEGHGAGVFALYINGKAKAFFAHQRLREKPPTGGVSVLSQSIELNPAHHALAKTLLDAVNWHGVAMVEFKVAEDGTAYLMEVNTRFWGSLQLAIDAGVDFPWLLYHYTFNADDGKVNDNYTPGKKLRWLLGDLDNLYLTIKDRNRSTPEKIHACIGFITPHLFSTRHEVNRLFDLAPAWYELKQYIRQLYS